MNAPIRVIGGGMTGLTVALRLAQRGMPVVVHERDPYLGGLSSESLLAGVPIERFYHCVLPTDAALLKLFDEVGLQPDAVGWQKTRTGFLSQGKLLDMTTTRDFMSFPALHPTDRLRLAWTLGYCAMVRDWRKLDGQPVGKFLKRHGGRRLFETIWEPLLISKLGPGYDRFAATFIWATAKRMLMARKAKGRSEKLGFVKGRYGRVFGAIRRKIESFGGSVCADQNVQGLIQGHDGESPWAVRVNRLELPAAGVVLCVPAPVAAGWLGDIAPAAAAALRSIEYLGVVCEVMLLRAPLTPYYILNLIDRPMPFTGVIELSNLAGREEFAGNALVYLPRYLGADSPTWQSDDETIHRENVAGLRIVSPDFDESSIVGWQIARARTVQPVHTVGGAGNIPPVSVGPGLAYVSTAQIRPWPVFNDEVVRMVDRSLAEVLRALGADGQPIKPHEAGRSK